MKENLVNLLSRLKQHWTLLVVTHDASDLVDIADNCWRMVNGKIESVNPDVFNLKKKEKIIVDKW